jgi:hypothetical protein
MSDQICSDCGKCFANKYTLGTHTRRVHLKTLDTNEPVELEQYTCPSSRCLFSTTYRAEFKKHIERCLFIIVDTEIERLQIEHHHEIERLQIEHRHEMDMKDRDWHDILFQKDMEIGKLSVRLEIMQQAELQLKRRTDEMIDCQLKHANDMVEKCIERPTCNNLYDDDKDHNDVEEIPLTITEQLNNIEDSSPSDYMMTLSHLTLNNVTLITMSTPHNCVKRVPRSSTIGLVWNPQKS